MIKERKTCVNQVLDRIVSGSLKMCGYAFICLIGYIAFLICMNNYEVSKCMKEHNVTDGYGICYFDD